MSNGARDALKRALIGSAAAGLALGLALLFFSRRQDVAPQHPRAVSTSALAPRPVPSVTPPVPPVPAAAPAAPVANAPAASAATPRAGVAAPLGFDLSSPEARRGTVAALYEQERRRRAEAQALAARQGWDPSPAGPCSNGVTAIRNGRVYARTTFNRNAGISAAVDQIVRTPPYDLSGTGVLVGVWDKGSIRQTHQEFGGRVSVKDGAAAHYHSTHVGGTVGAAGVAPEARGMAPAARLDSYDWDYDTAEMTARAMARPGESNTLQLANQSYGYQCGWSGNTWYGTWGHRESDGFGLYDVYAAEADALCWAAPYFLPFKAAGNDRNDAAPWPGQSFSYFATNGWQTKRYDPATDPGPDGWDNGGYDTLAYDANAKNPVIVGAVEDAVAGGRRSLAAAAMSGFSSWGPTDDGRVKPDLVANGTYLYSTYTGSDQDYRTMSGTSMAAPSAAGAAALLVEDYARLCSGAVLRASTLKALLIHTADDLDLPGPDYRFGWGLINARAAADHLRAHAAHPQAGRLVEGQVSDAAPEREFVFRWDNTRPIRATLAWTDPPGPPRSALDDRAPVLVHDLDLSVSDPAGRVWLPFTLDPEHPAEAAQTGVNRRDNVEQVQIEAPPRPGLYRVVVRAAAPLSVGGAQAFSLLISGVGVPPAIEHTPLPNTTNDAAPYAVEARLASETPLQTNACAVFWNTTGSPYAFLESPLRPVSNDTFRAWLPAQPRGTTVYYYLRARAANGLTTLWPAGAPSGLLSFAVTPPVTLTVGAEPAAVGEVEPGYGAWQYASGLTVRATAGLLSEAAGGVRYTCVGWLGTGSVPALGASNAVEFVIERESTLVWRWDEAYELAQTSSVAGLVATSTWWRARAAAETVRAPEALAREDAVWRFTGWHIDGARWPDAGARAQNPAAGIAMATSRTAVAAYLDERQDADGDGVPDWWELFYFGTVAGALEMDSDGDGFSDRMEFMDGADPRAADSTPQPPAIAHQPLAETQSRPAPWPVAAAVTDNQAVAAVTLQWRRNAGLWQSAAMTPDPASGRYTNALPAPGVTGDEFEYRIVARDAAGLQAVNGPYALQAAYPLAQVKPADFGTLYLPPDSILRTGLAVSNAGHVALTWSLSLMPVGWEDDVENGTNGWTHMGANDVWHRSTNRAHSGASAWYFGSDTLRSYPDRAKAQLVSPPVYLAGGARLSFWHWLATEELKDETHAWDGGLVELSTDNGATYTIIEPVGGYPYVIFGHSASAFPDGTPCFAGTGGWQEAQFDLAPYAGREVQIRFHFGSDGYVVNEGWFIDDVRIAPYGGAADWLSLPQTNGLTAPQAQTSLILSLSSAPLAPAETRQAMLRLVSDDPTAPRQLLPIALHNLSREIVVAVQGRGTVTPPDRARVLAGESAAFLAVAAPYHHLCDLLTNGVSIGGPFCVAATNFVWDNIWQNGSLLAVFAPNRTAREVPEFWLAEHGLTNGGFEAAALADQDADGLAAWQEYVAGTDPTAALSRLAFERVQPWATGFVTVVVEGEPPEVWTTQRLPLVEAQVLEWPSASQRWYTLYGGPQPGAVSNVVAAGLPATPPLNSHTVSVHTAGPWFYRLGVEWPER